MVKWHKIWNLVISKGVTIFFDFCLQEAIFNQKNNKSNKRKSPQKIIFISKNSND